MQLKVNLMETNRNETGGSANSGQQHAESRHRDGEMTNEEIVRKASEEHIQEKEEDRRFHQEHGNRKYRMFTNHSSADDQPMTDTGTP